ncbi:MAG: LPS export ABC transporter periplasmic protein LptC [Pseudomonadota bacterium]
MAETAAKRRWAEPGSAHDKLVRWSKIALPMAVGVLVAILALAPLDQKGDVSFILDKKKVASAPERMRVESARYTGTDDKGQLFVISAKQAVQQTSDVPIVDIKGMFAQLSLAQGPLSIAANQGRYDLDSQKVSISGPVRVVGPDGYKLETRDVTVNMKDRQLASAGPVSGQMRLGEFQAGHLQADLGTRTVVLNGGARLKIVQGAVR